MPLTPAQHEYNIHTSQYYLKTFLTKNGICIYNMRRKIIVAVETTIKKIIFKVINIAQRKNKSVTTQSNLRNLMLLTKILYTSYHFHS